MRARASGRTRVATAASLVALGVALHASPEAHAREVVFVTNAEGGTVSLVDSRSFRVLKTIDMLPDGPQSSFEENPAHAVFGQQVVEAAGGENYAQDQDLSPDGRTLYVSRGHRGDVAAFEITTGKLRWKVPIPGLRADHMTISRDGSRLYVSALTDDHVYAIDTATHSIVGSFPTGEWPHDNHLSHDGKLLYNGSIGNVVAPPESRGSTKPAYRLTIVDAATLEEVGAHVFDRGIRPFVITHDGRRVYAQLSEFHGVIEFGLLEGRVLRRRELPIDPGVTEEDYDFEAPHHGLAMTPDESTLCAAGRASDYVALLSTKTLAPFKIIEVDDAPGWTAVDPRGKLCFVANTRADTLSVISLARREEVRRLKLGDGPKQIEIAQIPETVVCAKPRIPGCRPNLRLRARCVRRGRVLVRLAGDTAAVRRSSFAVAGRVVARDRKRPFVRTLRRHVQGKRVKVVAQMRRGVKQRRILVVRAPRCARA